MKSTLFIKDLERATELSQQQMSTVRGGQGDQANGTSQNNVLAAFSPVSVGNDSLFCGSGPVTMQADSKVNQTASNYNDSTNVKGLFALGLPVVC